MWEVLEKKRTENLARKDHDSKAERDLYKYNDDKQHRIAGYQKFRDVVEKWQSKHDRV